MKPAIVCSAVTLFAAASAVRADTVVFYNFNNGSAAPTTVGSNLAASSVTARDTAAFPDRQQTALTADGFADADRNAFQFTVTVAVGFQLNLSNFSVFTDKSGSGPAGSTLFVNGVDSGSFSNPSTFSNTSSSLPLALSGLTGTTTFSLVGTGATLAAGNLRINDLTVEGTVSAVPSPSGFSAMALFGLAAIRRRRPASA